MNYICQHQDVSSKGECLECGKDLRFGMAVGPSGAKPIAEPKQNVLIGFHGSSTKIKKLDYNILLKSIVGNDNGALGLWCSTTDNEWVRGIGSYLHVVEVHGKSFDMPINTLSDMNNLFKSKDEYVKFRKEKLAAGYSYFRLIENDGICHMLVVMDFEKAKIISVL